MFGTNDFYVSCANVISASPINQAYQFHFLVLVLVLILVLARELQVRILGGYGSGQ